MSGFGIYLHWPYCTAICPYCDFNVYRARGGDNTALLAAIETDIAAHGERLGKREAASIFFGGGTPSLLNGADIARLIDACARAFALKLDCEITLEANPEDAHRFAEQAASGINRFSIGVQALDDAALKSLGRMHGAASALRAVEVAAATGQRVSLDLIYAREGQSIADWRDELGRALALPVEHLSLYQLTVEAGTAFARRVDRGELKPPENAEAAAFFETTQSLCEAAGFSAYEISNHARGEQARSRHNLIYWRGGDWIGVGPGAHGRIALGGACIATEAHRRPADYIDAVASQGIGWAEHTALSGEEIADEMLIMGLRVEEGIALARVEALRGKPLNADALAWLSAQDLLRVRDGRVRLTAAGRLLTNTIVTELVRD